MTNAQNEPLVSIITPVFNAAPFLAECIDSVLAQTYPHWELMLIDDGSTDGSTAIAEQYAALHPEKIRCLRHEGGANCGASASRNLGIRSSSGSFIAFLDADDIYLPHKLQDQVPLLLAHPTAGMLYAATEYWYSWSGKPEDRHKDWIWNGFGISPDCLVQPPFLLQLFLSNGSTVPCMGSVLARRSAIEAVGGWEASFTYVNTDQVFHAKMCLHYPVYVASPCWDRYRQHAASSTEKVIRSKKAFEARQTYLRWLRLYLQSEGAFAQAGLRAAFQKAFRPYQNKYVFQLWNFKNRLLAKLRS